MTETGIMLLGLVIWMSFYEHQWTDWLPAQLFFWGCAASGSLCVALGFFNFFKGLLT